MPGLQNRQFYLTDPFGREHWIADRYGLSLDRVKTIFQAMDCCEFAGTTELTGAMLSDWPPPASKAKSNGPPKPSSKSGGKAPAVVRARDLSEIVATSNDPRIRAAVDRVLAIESQRQQASPTCCSFCGKSPQRAGTMLEVSDWQSPNRTVRICSPCAEMAISIINYRSDIGEQ